MLRPEVPMQLLPTYVAAIDPDHDLPYLDHPYNQTLESNRGTVQRPPIEGNSPLP